MRKLESQKPNSIVLDLRKLNFLDSAGLGRVLAVQRRASRDGRRLVVVRGCRAVERLFALTALDLRLEMVSDPRAALQGSAA
jgi:anti-sigma B factor antagonist